MIKICSFCHEQVNGPSFLQCLICNCYYHVNCLRLDFIQDCSGVSSWYCIDCYSTILPYNHILDNSEFLSALSESWSEKVSSCISSDKQFLPFDFNIDDKQMKYLSNDPDTNYYNDISSTLVDYSKYYCEDSFIQKCNSDSLDNHDFSLLHLNIRSIPKNLLYLTTYLETLLFKFTIIGITETWLKEHNVNSYNIHGYNIVHNYRRHKMGGGVCFL